MTGRELTIRYVTFAAIATVANLGTQRMVFLMGTTPFYFGAAVAAGTGVGLIAKYVLDKNWIFYDTGQGLRDHSQKFSLYVLMGLFTTAIFWGSESLFWFATHDAVMRELGALTGLAIGYFVKYRLDRKFVFTSPRSVPGQTL